MIPSPLNRATVINTRHHRSSTDSEGDIFYDARTHQPDASSVRESLVSTHRPTTAQTDRDASAQLKHRSVHVTVRPQSVYEVGNISYNTRNEYELHQTLAGIFSKHINEANESELLPLISNRATELHAMGETPDGLDAIVKKGNTLDIMAQFARGFARSIPFAIASVAFDKIPALSAFANGPAELGLHAGLQASSIDTFGSLLLDRATANHTWFSANQEKLEPVMKDIAKSRQPTAWQNGVNMGIGFEAYSLRNLVRLFLVPLTNYASNPQVAAEFDTWLTGGGGATAGGLSSLYVNYRNHCNGSMGAEYLLGRNDWKEQYQALKDTPMIMGPLKGLAARTLKFPIDLTTEIPRSLRGVFTAANIGKSAAVGGGFAAIIKLRDMTSQAMKSGHFNSASVAAMSHLVNVVTCIPVFGVVPPIEFMAPSVSDKLTNVLQEQLPAALKSSAAWFGSQAKSLIGYTNTPSPTAEGNEIEMMPINRRV